MNLKGKRFSVDPVFRSRMAVVPPVKMRSDYTVRAIVATVCQAYCCPVVSKINYSDIAKNNSNYKAVLETTQVLTDRDFVYTVYFEKQGLVSVILNKTRNESINCI